MTETQRNAKHARAHVCQVIYARVYSRRAVALMALSETVLEQHDQACGTAPPLLRHSAHNYAFSARLS